MKAFLALVMLFFSISSQAGERVILPGSVYAGADLLCKVRNHTQDDLTISMYSYRILRVNNFGQQEWIRIDYRCGFNCEMSSGQQLFLTGPLNRRNYLQAQCWALAELQSDDGDDQNDDDDDSLEQGYGL